MFTEISWNNYIISVIVLLVIYYLFIGFRYYRSDLLELLSGTKSTQTDRVSFIDLQTIRPEQTQHQANLKQAFEKQDLFQVTQSVGDEIMAYLNEAGRDTLNKEDIIQSMKSLIAKYPSVKDSAFRDAIQNLIIKECETNCSIHLSEEEISALW